jgi:hypothetical protein
MIDMTLLNWTCCMAAAANDFGKFEDWIEGNLEA